MKRSIVFLLLVMISVNVFAQDKVTVTLSSLCYKKGYLNYILTFENRTDSVVSFTGSVLKNGLESMFTEQENINLFKNGASIYYLTDENGKDLHWFGFPMISYKCKKDKQEYSDFVLRPKEKKSFSLVLCLKKYEKIISGATVEIRFDIVQNLPANEDNKYFNGILKTNSAYFKP
jgi:hypothetical protein